MLWNKIKTTIWVILVLCLVLYIQTLLTRLYVYQNVCAQAFSQNHIQMEENSSAAADTRNTKEGNYCQEGTVSGRMTADEMKKLAQNIFRRLGGAEVMMSSESEKMGYFVAYGYTNGLAEKKNVNGKIINLNVVMTYEEESDKTRIVLGTPLVNSDF